MITPTDIHNQEFKRSFRGYDEQEVDDFLDRIVNDYESVFRENAQLKGEAEVQTKQIDQYRQIEKNLQDTLLVAQKTAEEVIQNAKLRAEEIREATVKQCENMKLQAQMELEKYQATLRENVRREEEKYDIVLQRERQFLIKMKALFRTELDLLEEDGVRRTVGDLSDAPVAAEAAENAPQPASGKLPLPWELEYCQETASSDADGQERSVPTQPGRAESKASESENA